MANDIVLPPSFAAEINDLKARIASLERAAPKLTSSSVSDAAGVKRLEIGAISNPVTGSDDFGLIVRESGGSEVLVVGNDGLVTPGVNAQILSPDSIDLIPDTSWGTSWRFYFWGITADAVLLHHQVAAQADVTSAEMRLQSYSLNLDGSGTGVLATSSTRSVTTGGAFNTYQWAWLHGVDLDDEKGLLIELQMQVTGSSGSANALRSVEPRFGIQSGSDAISATSAGFS